MQHNINASAEPCVPRAEVNAAAQHHRQQQQQQAQARIGICSKTTCQPSTSHAKIAALQAPAARQHELKASAPDAKLKAKLKPLKAHPLSRLYSSAFGNSQPRSTPKRAQKGLAPFDAVARNNVRVLNRTKDNKGLDATSVTEANTSTLPQVLLVRWCLHMKMITRLCKAQTDRCTVASDCTAFINTAPNQYQMPARRQHSQAPAHRSTNICIDPAIIQMLMSLQQLMQPSFCTSLLPAAISLLCRTIWLSTRRLVKAPLAKLLWSRIPSTITLLPS